MTTTTETLKFKVGDRVTSVYGHEHVGEVVEVGAFADGGPMYHVRRDLDGFVWIGMWGTVLPVAALS